MLRASTAFLLGMAICFPGFVRVAADDQKSEIKGGIEGKVKNVDVEGQKLTITTTQGRERTFNITDDTTMVGPRGGKVRKHLKDPRFHEGFPLIIVADGNTAEEVHLGYAKDAPGAVHAKAAKEGSRPDSKSATEDNPKKTTKTTTPPPDAATIAKHIARHKEATKLEEEDDEQEILGHIKSFDAGKRSLVVTLLNGKSRSFILAKNVPVHIKGAAAASKEGLEDPELKAGAYIIVVTDEGGRKVKELKITPASAAKRKRAG
jgi:hypothetical protein